jgi:hypothetical protein
LPSHWKKLFSEKPMTSSAGLAGLLEDQEEERAG